MCSIPPNSVERYSCRSQVGTIDSDSSLRERVQANKGRRERNETDSQEKEYVDPQEYSVGSLDVVKLGMVADPEESKHYEAECISGQIRP